MCKPCYSAVQYFQSSTRAVREARREAKRIEQADQVTVSVRWEWAVKRCENVENGEVGDSHR